MIAQGLQKIINRYLALDAESKHRLSKLQGKVISLKLLGLNITVQMIFVDELVEIKLRDFVTADTVIQGAPLGLLQIALQSENRKTVFAHYAVIDGDLDLGQDVIALFDELEIDWEEHLSKWVGDVPAHHAGRLVKKFKTAASRVEKSLTRNIQEYIHEEKNIFPPKEALNDFFQDIDELRSDVDRLEARVNQLMRLL